MNASDPLHETRTFYDAIAHDYDERYRDVLAGMPLERAMLGAFTELVQGTRDDRDDRGDQRDPGPVADLGCGPGRVTAHLSGLGLSVFGVDLSPAMVALARRTYPELRFEEGSMTGLDLPDASLGGIVAWYSLIHLPLERLPQVFAEFHRVLAPGAPLLVAFQVGDEPLRIDQPFGHPVSLDFRRRQPDDIAALLADAGLPVRARLLREPGAATETAPQATLLAGKPEPDRQD